MIDKHKDKRKYNNFGYLSTKFWLNGNDRNIHSIKLYVNDGLQRAQNFPFIRSNKQFNSNRCLSLFTWEQEGIRGEFQTKALSLVHTITERRIRHASCPAHHPVHCMYYANFLLIFNR